MGSLLCHIGLRACRALVRLNAKGQATSEYVLLILALVLFLAIAASVLVGSLNSAVAVISNWIAAASPPPV